MFQTAVINTQYTSHWHWLGELECWQKAMTATQIMFLIMITNRRSGMVLTLSTNSTHLIAMKVSKAALADLNVSPIQYWGPSLGSSLPPDI